MSVVGPQIWWFRRIRCALGHKKNPPKAEFWQGLKTGRLTLFRLRVETLSPHNLTIAMRLALCQSRGDASGIGRAAALDVVLLVLFGAHHAFALLARNAWRPVTVRGQLGPDSSRLERL